jgi:hypothetical protein
MKRNEMNRHMICILSLPGGTIALIEQTQLDGPATVIPTSFGEVAYSRESYLH